MPLYLWMDEVIPPFTAGQHHVAAGVAQVDGGLAGFPLTPQPQAQAAAVTALLQNKGTVSNEHLEALNKLPGQWWSAHPWKCSKNAWT